MSLLKNWGMGKTESGYYCNDREYNWYIDQAKTGPYSDNNCGHASASMAAKWYDESFSKTTEQARNMYLRNGGWWNTSDIISYLQYCSIPYHVYAYNNPKQIVDIIKDGDIIILCINTEHIKRNYKNEQRVNRFYDYSSGHFVLAKGVRKVDETIYVEVYDPNTYDERYTDNSQKGKNRHYILEDVSKAISYWWNYLIVIHSEQDLAKTSRTSFQIVNPDQIDHKWGK